MSEILFENRLHCYDCSRDLEEINQIFMIKDHLWKSFGEGENSLCVDCLEQRMKRRLLLNDFTFTTVNAIYLSFNRERHLPKI